MTAQSSVSQRFVSQFCALFRTRHQGRAPVLALLVLGLVRVRSVTLETVAAAVVASGRRVQVASVERQFRRWLSNPQVTVESFWRTLTPSLLADWAGRAVTLVFDGTPQGKHWTVLTIGVVQGDRVLPLAGIVKPQQCAWGATTAAAIRPACERIAAAIPAGATVTFLADQGLTGPDLIDLCQEVGWHCTLRINATAAPTTRVRTGDGREYTIAELRPRRSRRSSRMVVVDAAVYRAAGWRWGWITISWGRRYAEPWVLFSDQPGGRARVQEYRQRVLIEATFQDLKSRGWQVEGSHLHGANRIERLLLALYLAYWWLAVVGRRTIRAGQRRRVDQAARRSRSVVSIGRRACAAALTRHRLPRWFSPSTTGWRVPLGLPARTPPPQCVR